MHKAGTERDKLVAKFVNLKFDTIIGVELDIWLHKNVSLEWTKCSIITKLIREAYQLGKIRGHMK